MLPRRLVDWLVVGCLGLVALLVLGAVRLDRSITGRADRLDAAAGAPSEAAANVDPLSAAADDSLPAPVKRYFGTVLGDDWAQIRAARLTQHGAMRLGDPDGSWTPLTATQHVTVDPPGFLWDAELRVGSVVPIRVVDAYEFGTGSLTAWLLSAVPVVDAEPTPALAEGELLRYLAEAVWVPTALHPAAGVEWDAIDDHTARATITDRGTTASLVFEFDQRGLVDRVRGERYRQETDSYAPWVGSFDRYEWRDGVRIPTAATVAWDGPDGEQPYWRGTVDAVTYDR